MRRARLPTHWLFTDERLGGSGKGDALWQAVARLPRGGGVVVRHYGWPEAERRALLKAMNMVARRRGIMVVASRLCGAVAGVHRPAHARRRSASNGLVTASAHGRRDLVQAFRAGADLVFLSPVFATASHPGGRVLGPVRFGLAVRGARSTPGPVIALGGMTARRAARLKPLGASGFAGIDCWRLPGRQMRPAVSPGFPARAAGR